MTFPSNSLFPSPPEPAVLSLAMSPYPNRQQSVTSDTHYESLSLRSSTETLVAPTSVPTSYQPQLPPTTSQTYTPITPNTPIQHFRDPEALAPSKRRRITPEDILGPLTIGFFCVVLVVGFGALLGYCNFSIGCIALKKKSDRCKGTGALGGLFASVPGILGFFGVRWIYHALDRRQRSGWAAVALIFLLPILCIGFGITGGVIGWAILSRTDPSGIEFGMGKAIVIAVVGSASTCIVVSLALGRLAVGS